MLPLACGHPASPPWAGLSQPERHTSWTGFPGSSRPWGPLSGCLTAARQPYTSPEPGLGWVATRCGTSELSGIPIAMPAGGISWSEVPDCGGWWGSVGKLVSTIQSTRSYFVMDYDLQPSGSLHTAVCDRWLSSQARYSTQSRTRRVGALRNNIWEAFLLVFSVTETVLKKSVSFKDRFSEKRIVMHSQWF